MWLTKILISIIDAFQNYMIDLRSRSPFMIDGMVAEVFAICDKGLMPFEISYFVQAILSQ